MSRQSSSPKGHKAAAVVVADPPARGPNWPFPRRENTREGETVEISDPLVGPITYRTRWRAARVVTGPDALLAVTVVLPDGAEHVVDRRHWRRY